MTPPTIEGGRGRRLLWFVALYCAGVAVVGLVALILRIPLKLAG